MPQPNTGYSIDHGNPLWTFDDAGNLIVEGNVYIGGKPDQTKPPPSRPLVPGTALGAGPASGQAFLPFLLPSGDTTGVTDTANIAAFMSGFPRKYSRLGPGTFYISAPIVPPNNTWLQGAGILTTTIQQGSAFSGTYMYFGQLSCTLSDLSLVGQTTTTANNPQADGVYITQNGGFVANVTIRSVRFLDLNGWQVHVFDDGTHGAMVGNIFDELQDAGGNAGGMAFFGAGRTMGMRVFNTGLSANGGTSTTLDGLYIDNVFDGEFDGVYFGAGGTSTGSAMHLHGHCNNMRFVRGEVGGGTNDLLIEDGTSGHSSVLQFIGIVFQTPSAACVSLTGSCTDVSFTNCEFNSAQTDGVDIATNSNKINFTQCRWGGGSVSNGKGATGTNYDLNWSGAGTGDVMGCDFGSNITSTGTAGVQASVNIAAAQDVSFTTCRFSGTGASSANWFTNSPAAAMQVSSGRFTFVSGLAAAPAGFTPSNPTQTASGTLVMMGLGATCVYTPTGTGHVLVNVTGTATTETGGANVTLGGRYGTGTAPANAAAVSGTRFGAAGDELVRGAGIGDGVGFALTAMLTLTAGTQYWFDLAIFTSNTSDPAAISFIGMSFVELPT